MDAPTVVALGPDTWELFAELQEGQGGLFGRCWCTWFHRSVDADVDAELGVSAEGNRAVKEQLVRDGRDHAALVVEDGQAVAWAAEKVTLPGRRPSCRTSTTVSSTTPRRPRPPTGGSRASRCARPTGGGAWPRRRCAATRTTCR